MISDEWLLRLRGWAKKRFTKGHEHMGYFGELLCSISYGNDPCEVYTYVQIYQIEYSTSVQCIVFQLFSNKAANFFLKRK